MLTGTWHDEGHSCAQVLHDFTTSQFTLDHRDWDGPNDNPRRHSWKCSIFIRPARRVYVSSLLIHPVLLTKSFSMQTTRALLIASGCAMRVRNGHKNRAQRPDAEAGGDVRRRAGRVPGAGPVPPNAQMLSLRCPFWEQQRTLALCTPWVHCL